MTCDYDIAIVGFGPIGQTLAILLGRMGHRVGVFERWPSPYPRPRAVHYDDEVARVFQRIGIGEQLTSITEPATTYEWQNAAGQTLLMLDRSGAGPSGWAAATMFTQPQLEELLAQTATATPGVEVRRGVEVCDIDDAGTHVTLSARRGEGDGERFVASGDELAFTAGFVVGCDGANSLVRERMGTSVTDLGFAFDWLIADTVPRDPQLLKGVNLQVCDPARPTTLVSGGPGRRRWEWMLLPGETAELMQQPDVVWHLLARSGVAPGDVELERHTVYTFRARWAECWRAGHMLLAGDAAHQMPPFAGQGMCSGIRDAIALAWRLDLVLTGRAGEGVLDSYTSERRGHLQHAIDVSVELGKVICIADEAEAAARDEVLLAAAAAADPGAPAFEPPSPPLGPGFHEADDEAGAGDDGDGSAGGAGAGDEAEAGAAAVGAAGSLFPQASAAVDGRECLLEDTLGSGFVLYALDAEPAGLLDGEQAEYLNELGASLVHIDAALDTTGAYRRWFERHGCAVALVRPDFYVFGTATTAGETRALVRRLQTALTTPASHQETVTT